MYISMSVSKLFELDDKGIIRQDKLYLKRYITIEHKICENYMYIGLISSERCKLILRYCLEDVGDYITEIMRCFFYAEIWLFSDILNVWFLLINRLVQIVEKRNEIIECLEMDRRREIEEDKSIHKHMGLLAGK